MVELTLKELISLPNDILRISSNNEYIDLLSKETIDQYYNQELKKKMQSYMRRFNDMKYLYQYSDSYSLKAVKYTKETKSKSSTGKSVVEEFVTKKIDNKLWVKEAYDHIISLSYKLSFTEQKYFVETFFKNESEEKICEKLGICRMTLQNIKKSCLVKMYLEINM